jgi:uncharacterized cupin superfamily protein
MTAVPIAALDVPVKQQKSLYPPPFAARVAGRSKHRLGDHFGLANFGVNLTELAPGAESALVHHHAVQDEFVYVVEGSPTLVLGDEEFVLAPGDCCGFKAGAGVGHQLVNRTGTPVLYLEVGDRTPGERVVYPNDDLALAQGADGAYVVSHKDGTPY